MKFGFNFDGGFFDFDEVFFDFSDFLARFLGVGLASDDGDDFRIGVLLGQLDLTVRLVTDAADVDAVLTDDVAMIGLR